MLGRNTQGVRLIRLDDGERLIGVETVEPEPESEVVDGEAADAARPQRPATQPTATTAPGRQRTDAGPLQTA